MTITLIKTSMINNNDDQLIIMIAKYQRLKIKERTTSFQFLGESAIPTKSGGDGEPGCGQVEHYGGHWWKLVKMTVMMMHV